MNWKIKTESLSKHKNIAKIKTLLKGIGTGSITPGSPLHTKAFPTRQDLDLSSWPKAVNAG